MEKSLEIAAAAQGHLSKLSEDVHKAMVANGAVPAGMDCRTECSISIGPDGKPVYTCRLVCGF